MKEDREREQEERAGEERKRINLLNSFPGNYPYPYSCRPDHPVR